MSSINSKYSPNLETKSSQQKIASLKLIELAMLI